MILESGVHRGSLWCSLVLPLRAKVVAGDQQSVGMKSLKKSLTWNFLCWRHSVCPKEEPKHSADRVWEEAKPG